MINVKIVFLFLESFYCTCLFQSLLMQSFVMIAHDSFGVQSYMHATCTAYLIWVLHPNS